jgi:transcription antitermination factor NusB
MLNPTRLRAVQFLYLSSFNHDIYDDAIVQKFFKHDFKKDLESMYKVKDKTFRHMLNIVASNKVNKKHFKFLVEGVLENNSNLDDIINSFLKEKIESIDRLTHIILRVGVFEILYNQDERVNSKIIVSDYTKITSLFYEGSTPKLVNAVLDKIYKS